VACNVDACGFDLGDCDVGPGPECAPGCPADWPGDGACDDACNVPACGFDGGDCDGGGGEECAPGCPVDWPGDGECDDECNVAACGFDGGDCGGGGANCPAPPAAPANLNAARQGQNTPQAEPVLVTWDYAGPAVSGFRVARLDPGEDRNDPNAWDNVGGDLPANARSYTDNPRQNGGRYSYHARAFTDAPGCERVFGAYSNDEDAIP
jgi:hypothetical protein